MLQLQEKQNRRKDNEKKFMFQKSVIKIKHYFSGNDKYKETIHINQWLPMPVLVQTKRAQFIHLNAM